jgi:DNA-3-methyladenine glycosylase
MPQYKTLPRDFFLPSARIVAPRLLGHWLIRQTPDGPCGGIIVETEAYLVGDAACHGAPGPTDRNRIMFGEPGHAYVYFIYGCHYCFNVVCQPAGIAEAILVRAIEPTVGEDLMRSKRRTHHERSLTDGPGKICAAMDISRALDGADLCDSAAPVLIAENPARAAFRRKSGPLVTTTRIGLTQAADLPLRFYLNGSSFVSRKLRRALNTVPGAPSNSGDD